LRVGDGFAPTDAERDWATASSPPPPPATPPSPSTTARSTPRCWRARRILDR